MLKCFIKEAESYAENVLLEQLHFMLKCVIRTAASYDEIFITAAAFYAEMFY